MPRAAYIHVPFCTHRCGYCNFTLVANRDDLVPAYLDALQRELQLLPQPQPVETIFLGGGTPTFLDPPALQRLLELVQHWHPLANGGEYSSEANPNDLTPAMVEQLKAHGVTRVSLGAQSFDAAKLQTLERSHNAAQIATAVELLQKAKLQVGIDLIFAVPGETRETWQNDLQMAIALQPDHISTYGLTWEKGTQFWNRRLHGDLQPLGEDIEQTLYEMALDTLPAAGFEHYEISNFARPGKRCRHNEIYWQGEEYFAVGPGAARYISGVRSSNHRSTTTWINRVLAGESPVAEQEQLSSDDRAREVLVFALRRIEGVFCAWFAEKTGHELNALVGPRLSKLVEHGLISDDGNAIRLTRRGIMLADSVCSELLKTT